MNIKGLKPIAPCLKTRIVVGRVDEWTVASAGGETGGGEQEEEGGKEGSFVLATFSIPGEDSFFFVDLIFHVPVVAEISVTGT